MIEIEIVRTLLASSRITSDFLSDGEDKFYASIDEADNKTLKPV